MSKYGLEKPEGLTFSRLPLIKMDVEFWGQAFNTFGVKLGCALHYKHTGKIIPRAGKLSVRFFTNLDVAAGRFPEEILDLARSVILGKRKNVDLGTQFAYRASVSEDGDIGLYIASIQGSLIYAVIVYFDPKLAEDENKGKVFSPLPVGTFLRD